MQVKKVSLGWKALNDILNDIIAAVNQNEPLSGAGIVVDKTATGSIIQVPVTNTDSTSTNPATTSGSTTTTDDDSAMTNAIATLQSQMQALQTLLNGAKSTAVNVVDPSTCNQSVIHVLTLPQ